MKLLHQNFTVHQLPLLEHKFYILLNCDATGNCVLLLRSLKSEGWEVQHFLNSGERRRQKEMSTNQILKEKWENGSVTNSVHYGSQLAAPSAFA
jgi:hypothetical protein